MLQILNKNKWFYIPYLLFIGFSSTILIAFSKKEIHLFINNHHCNIADFFFKNLTHLGDGITIGIFIFVMVFIKYRYAIILSFSTISVTIAIQAFKRYLLPDIKRPILFFYNLQELYLVPGVDVHTSHSFPSGHSASAFTLFLFLALIIRNKHLKLIAFIFALLIAYSRVYLSQHFLNDIYFGSLIAVFFTTLFYLWVSQWKNKSFDSSLLTTLRFIKNDSQ